MLIHACNAIWLHVMPSICTYCVRENGRCGSRTQICRWGLRDSLLNFRAGRTIPSMEEQFLKLMVDGVQAKPLSARTLPAP